MGIFNKLFGKKTATKTGIRKETPAQPPTEVKEEIRCAFCGQAIEQHEIANKTAKKIKQNGVTNYFHKKCWKKCRNEIKHRGFAAFR